MLENPVGIQGNRPGTPRKIHYVLNSTNLTVSGLRREGPVFATPPLEYNRYIKSGINTPSGKSNATRAIINGGNDTRF